MRLAWPLGVHANDLAHASNLDLITIAAPTYNAISVLNN